MAYVHVERAVKYFPREDGTEMLVLSGVSLDTKEYGTTCLLGPSGCGKSTLLNIISGLERLDQGHIEFRVSSPELRAPSPQPSSRYSKPETRNPKLGYVFQDPRLLNWKTVEGNLVFALKGMRVPQDEWEERIHKYLGLVGLIEFRKQYPLYLSGGMRQRVGLARGLVIEPQVLLMDEPYSKLDQLTARKLREDTLNICAQLKQTALLVTHDVEEAAYMGDRIVTFSARPAHIVEVLDNPFPPLERDFEDGRFIQFKKKLLQSVLKLVKEEA
jgi:ABC-type nitrate/sulfonate/bicarbonate transport system ATPase subunit